MRASLAIVVDSPPGMTRPSHASSSAGRRTATGRAPRAASDAQVLAHVALEREDADHGRGNGRHARRLAGQPRYAIKGWP